MAPKDTETIVFVVNIGVSKDAEIGREFVAKAKTIMKHIIQKKIFVRPKDEIGIILMGDKHGDHPELDKIDVYNSIEITTWDMVRKIDNITHEICCFTNWLDGISAALTLIKDAFNISPKPTIIVLADCPDDKLDRQRLEQDIVPGVISCNAQLLWIGSKDLKETAEDLNNSEKMLLNFCEMVHGVYDTFDVVLPNIQFYGVHKPNPTGAKCNLQIGDIAIPMRIYVYVQKGKSISFTKVAAKSEGDEGDLQIVSRTTDLVDRNKLRHNPDDTTRAVRYGKKYIPLTDEDIQNLKYSNTRKGFHIRGFMDSFKVKLDHRSGVETHVLLPEEEAAEPFAALVKAMNEMNQVALARRVFNDGNKPALKILTPHFVNDEPVCLFMCDHPYKDHLCEVDQQTHEEVLKTVSVEQSHLVDTFIDEMMILDPTIDDQDQRSFECANIHNPDIQYQYDVLADRALNTKNPEDYKVPPRGDHILKVLSAPDYLKNHRVERSIKRMQELFDLNREPEFEESETATTAGPSAATTPSTSTDQSNDVPPPVPVAWSSGEDVDMDALFDDE